MSWGTVNPVVITSPVTLTFLGGAGTVTGSKFLLERSGHRLLVDCGLFQGERALRRQNWAPFPVSPGSVDDVVITHCHLDHCGYLPVLVREGFSGAAWMTDATATLAAIVLLDSGHLNERDAKQAQEGGYSRHEVPRPLYTVRDAEQAAATFQVLGFGQVARLAHAFEVRLSRAGHVLGSASVLASTGEASVLFSGDLGRSAHPILRPRAAPPSARVVVIESTYGDRRHPRPAGEAHEAFADAIRRTVARDGSVLVPAFAVDRTELVLHVLSELGRTGRIPRVPVFVDSPMALTALDVYRQAGPRGELRPDLGGELIDLPDLHIARTPEESIALNFPRQPCIIVSASGMATGGRVVHHLRHMLPDRRNSVVLTGYQAMGTRGRALLDGARELKMHGRYIPVRAEIVQDEEFSVHADSDDLLAWLREMPEPPETVFVVHGEPEGSHTLAARIRQEIGCAVAVPEMGERVRVD